MFENMTATVDSKNVLTVKIDLGKRARMSGSGKSVIVGGTTNPPPKIKASDGTEITLSVSAYVKASDAEVARLAASYDAAA